MKFFFLACFLFKVFFHFNMRNYNNLCVCYRAILSWLLLLYMDVCLTLRPYSSPYRSSSSPLYNPFNGGHAQGFAFYQPAQFSPYARNAYQYAKPSYYAKSRRNHNNNPDSVIAKVDLYPGGKDKVYGTLYMNQDYPDGPVVITGIIHNLSPGQHGFHIHANGVSAQGDCKSAGGHFNPFDKDHGNPYSTDRHVGDLGNINSQLVYIIDSVISLDAGAENGILGRAVVVHAGPDDLGQGGDDESLKTGNAGGRIACGNIVPIDLH